jgi:WD40 repeat protein
MGSAAVPMSACIRRRMLHTTCANSLLAVLIECTSWQVAPCALQPVSHAGEFICIGGTDCKATLCTSDGTMLATLATRGGWVWCVSGHPKKNFVAVGSEDGSIAVYQLLFSTVHGLYHDRYAFRQD